MVNSEEILQAIPNEDLPELARIYEKYAIDYPYVHSLIKVGIRWKSLDPNDKRVNFYSPRNCWRNDGTFLAIFTFTNESDVIFFTLDDSAKNLLDGIRYTKRKEFNQEVNFHCTHDKFTDLIVRTCAESRNMKVTKFIRSHMVMMTKDEALKLKIECPPEVYLKPVEIRDVPQINSVWPRKYDGSEIKIAAFVEMNGGIGAYLKETDQLVAWVLLDQMGQVAVLQTHEDFKQKGYASLVTKALSKKLAEDGVHPFAGVFVTNTASLKMFTKCGYKNIGPHTYFYMAPPLKNKL